MRGTLTSDGQQPLAGTIARLMPGLALAAGIAVLALTVQRASGISALSPLVVAIGIGIGLRNLAGRPEAARPGLTLAMKPLLRLAIVLLGFQITVAEVGSMGLKGLIAVTTTLAATFVFTKLAGRALGVEPRLAELIAAGTSVCGASAIIACNTVTRGSDEDVAYALACVTLFGTMAMLVLPLLAGPLGLTAKTYGLWTGATIHEVAQVVGAAFAQGEAAGHAGTVAKLSRVILLAPLILLLGLMRNRGDAQASRVPPPWFVFGFIAAIALNSVIALPPALIEGLKLVTAFLLTAALAAMGLETDMRKLRLKGGRPLLLGGVATLFICGVGLLLVRWAMA